MASIRTNRRWANPRRHCMAPARGKRQQPAMDSETSGGSSDVRSWFGCGQNGFRHRAFTAVAGTNFDRLDHRVPFTSVETNLDDSVLGPDVVEDQVHRAVI